MHEFGASARAFLNESNAQMHSATLVSRKRKPRKPTTKKAFFILILFVFIFVEQRCAFVPAVAAGVDIFLDDVKDLAECVEVGECVEHSTKFHDTEYRHEDHLYVEHGEEPSVPHSLAVERDAVSEEVAPDGQS